MYLITVKICTDGTKSAMKLLERYINCVSVCIHVYIGVLVFVVFLCRNNTFLYIKKDLVTLQSLTKDMWDLLHVNAVTVISTICCVALDVI